MYLISEASVCIKRSYFKQKTWSHALKKINKEKKRNEMKRPCQI